MTKIRRANYVTKYDDGNTPMVSLRGEFPDESLCDYNFVAKEKYKIYKEEYISHGTNGTNNLSQIDERRKLDGKILTSLSLKPSPK